MKCLVKEGVSSVRASTTVQQDKKKKKTSRQGYDWSNANENNIWLHKRSASCYFKAGHAIYYYLKYCNSWQHIKDVQDSKFNYVHH